MKDRLDRFGVMMIDTFRAADAELLRLFQVFLADFAATAARIRRALGKERG